jgi:hypothetical protein
MFRKLYTIAQNKLRLRPPLYVIRKYRRITSWLNSHPDESNQENEPINIYDLARNGLAMGKNLVDSDTISSWQTRYGIAQSSFSPNLGNLSIPFYNPQMHELLHKSPIASYLDQYFKIAYRTKPVLQQVPVLVVTYPEVSHDSHIPSKHNFPAVWHVDYRSEFTIHLPLTIIDQNTSHTKYKKGSHYSTVFLPNEATCPDPSKIVNVFGSPGDAIFMDVDGLHRAHLGQNNLRVIVQLKFTTGNDMLHICDVNHPKLYKNIARTKEHFKNYSKIRAVLLEDCEFIKSLPKDTLNSPMLKHVLPIYALYTSET